MTLYVDFPLNTCIMLRFDNGGVHNLLVGSEPTHCIGYLYVCITGFKLLYSTLGGVTLMIYVFIIVFIALCFAGRCSRCHAPGFGTRLVRGLG